MMQWFYVVVLLLRVGVPGWSLMPRKTVRYFGATEVRRFWRPGTSHYMTLTLDDNWDALYVGAREVILSLDMSNIAKELRPAIVWETPGDKKAECVQKGKNNQTECFNYILFLQEYNETHLITCGTYAFQPKCAYIEVPVFNLDRENVEDGRGKCPYDPFKGHTGLIVDGALYTATLNNFLGTEPVIQRHLEQHHNIRTEYQASWLNEPNFVGSSHIPESDNSDFGDDDKIYFFFTERALEYDSYSEQVVSRVARVCKGDLGGVRILQRKWTSFLKARLVCSIPKLHLHFNLIQSVFTLRGDTWRSTQFFAIFQARLGDFAVSAVCQYSIRDIQRVFDGPYKEYHEHTKKWGQFSDPVPRPRPGSCITDWHRRHRVFSSLELPDNTLNFAKRHLLMHESVLPVHERPLLVRKQAHFTKLAVHRVTGLDRKPYDVMFIGTGDGCLIKAVSLGANVHVIEELQVFDKSRPVQSLVLSSRKGLVFAGSISELVQLPFADCSKYHSCDDCLLARDPYCAWNINSSRCVHADELSTYVLLQDVQGSDTSLCEVHHVKSGVTDVRRFWRPGTSHYMTLTLDDNRGALYVGAREVILSLDISNITKEMRPAIVWETPGDKKAECVQKGKNNQTECFNYILFLQEYNETHLITCGTYAFQPKCTYIEVPAFTLDRENMEDGRGKCPYDPFKGHTGLIVDGALYSATLNNFLGTEAVIQRHLGQHHNIRTEYQASWLNEPNFVGSSHILEIESSDFGDDDKIYFFFTERAIEYDSYNEQVVSRVARVCKGDLGGSRTLQRKWTSFLKARLVCSIPELHFNLIQSVFTLRGDNLRSTQFFAIFQARLGDFAISAVCQYSIQDIQRVFDGPFKEYHEHTKKWGQFSDPVPSPRPGSCITDWHRRRNVFSSLELPDNTLNFARMNPLMHEYVLPIHGRPLLVRKGAKFTQLAVHRVTGLDGKTYDVMFIGTGDGCLIKAVRLGADVHVIEELQVFDKSHPVQSLVLSPRKGLLFTGSISELVQLPLADCNKHRSCDDCLLAQDPYCVWNIKNIRCVHVHEFSRYVTLQDVQGSDPSLCEVHHVKSVKPLLKNLTVVIGTNVVLPCQLTTNLAQPSWTFNGRDLRQEGDSVLFGVIQQALVIMGVGPHHSGSYYCFSVEHGTRIAMEGYKLNVISASSHSVESQAPMDGFGLV